MLSRIVLLIISLAVLISAPGTAQVPQIPIPQNLSATVSDAPAVVLTWDMPAGLWFYRVYRAGATGTDYQSIGVASSARYSDLAITPGEKYMYAVAAAGLAGGAVAEGAKSKPVTVTIPATTTKGVISGRVTDEGEGSGVPYAQVLISSTADTTRWVQVITDLGGKYSVPVDPGTYTILVEPPHSSLKAWQPEWYDNAADRAHATPVVVAAGATLTINIALGSGAATTALLQIIHNAADPAAATVDVYLDSTLILNDFAFRHATPFLSVPAGSAFKVRIAPGNSTGVADAVKELSITLDPGKKYVLIACGVLSPGGFAANPDGRDIAFSVFALEPALTSGTGGNVHLAVMHGVTDAPAVDIVARGVATIVDNAGYGDRIPYVAVPPAAYVLDVNDSSGSTVVASFAADLRSLGNQSAVVFASGFLMPTANENGEALGLFAAFPSGAVLALPPEGTPPPGDGLLAGSVSDEVSGLPVSGTRVIAFRTHHTVAAASWTRTATDGTYGISLPPGTYFIRFEPAAGPDSGKSYLAEWYDNAGSILEAAPVNVVAGDTTIANAALTPAAPVVRVRLSGTVMDTAGMPLADAHVVVMRSIQDGIAIACMPGTIEADLGCIVDIPQVGKCHGVIWTGTTNAAGEYEATLRGGRSYIVLAAKAGYISEYFNNKSSPLTADRITLTTNDTTGIALSLIKHPAVVHTVGGTVKACTGKGVPARVVLFPTGWITLAHHVRSGHTDTTGVFEISNVSPGRYILMAIPDFAFGPAFYKAGACGVVRWREADILDVNGDLTGITVGVVPVKGYGVAWLCGHVQAESSAPVVGADVIATSEGGEVLGFAITDAEGAFTIQGVAAGSVILTADAGGYEPAIVPVPVPDGSAIVAGIDLGLRSVAVSTEPPSVLPSAFGLAQNYPNPFNPGTVIGVDLPVDGRVTVAVFNLLGQRVATVFEGMLTAGRHSMSWDGRDANGIIQASGVYLCRMEAHGVGGAGAAVTTIKMMLVR